jgi:hypothetical protein
MAVLLLITSTILSSGPIEPVSEETIDPCRPSPCGYYSECAVSYGNTAQCTCMIGYLGAPPNCRPECLVNPDCPSNKACIQEKCQDPCTGACASTENCQVISHKAACSCPPGTRGSPYSAGCTPIPPSKFPFFVKYLCSGLTVSSLNVTHDISRPNYFQNQFCKAQF